MKTFDNKQSEYSFLFHDKRKGMITIFILKWKKVIKKEQIENNGERHIVPRVFIGLCNTVTGEYLISPFSDFLNQFANNKTMSANCAADIIVRFLNYIYFSKVKSIYDITIQDGIEYLNSLNVKKDTQYTYASYITKFYYFLAKKDVLTQVSIKDFSYTFDKAGRKVLANLFIGRFIESKKQNEETIHNIKKEYLYTFIKTAIDVVPDIAFGVFLQCFGGLRKSEVVSLEYKNISVRTIDAKKFMHITLKDKDLREDISTAFLAGCKRNRTQAVFPAFDNLLWELFEKHKANYKTKSCSAVFIDSNGRPMTDAVYYKRFCKLKNAFIKRLRESEDYDAKSYAVYLDSFKWSTHICRGIFSNLVAESTDNIMEIATWRGDRNLSSALSYLTDRKQTEEKVLHGLNEMYRKEIN